MAEREVRYCTTEDGVRIAYCVEGEGPALLVCPNLFESFSLEHLSPWYRNFMSGLSAGRRVVRFDPRGIGLSQEAEDYSLGGLLSDLKAVSDSAELTHCSLLGIGVSGQRAILFASRYAEQVDSLILFSSWARTADTYREDSLRALAELARSNWYVAAQAFVSRLTSPEAEESLVEMYRRSVKGDAVARMILANLANDVSTHLGSIKAPTLVLHHTNNNLLPLAIAQQMASAIPNAALVPLEVSDPEEWLKMAVAPIDSFLRKHSGERQEVHARKQGPLRTVLFTDLVGHSEMMSRLGDERGREVLREHERITREVLKAHGGTEVKTMGDGFMASFGSVAKAVECAMALQRAFDARNRGEVVDRGVGAQQLTEGGSSSTDEVRVAAPLRGSGSGHASGEPLHIRVGLNAGEPIEEEGDLFGATVILASRIAAKAEGGEILVADTVRGLCSGKGFLFADRGEFVAKGFEEPVRVYEVRWRDG